MTLRNSEPHYSSWRMVSRDKRTIYIAACDILSTASYLPIISSHNLPSNSSRERKAIEQHWCKMYFFSIWPQTQHMNTFTQRDIASFWFGNPSFYTRACSGNTITITDEHTNWPCGYSGSRGRHNSEISFTNKGDGRQWGVCKRVTYAFEDTTRAVFYFEC